MAMHKLSSYLPKYSAAEKNKIKIISLIKKKRNWTRAIRQPADNQVNPIRKIRGFSPALSLEKRRIILSLPFPPWMAGLSDGVNKMLET